MTAAAIARPNKGRTRVAVFGPHARRLAQRNQQGRFKGVRKLVALATADHKVLARDDALGSRVLISHGIDAKLGRNGLQIAGVLRRHAQHERAAGTHPTHNVAQARTEPIKRRHEHNHAVKRRERRNGIRAIGGNIHIAMGNLHVEQNLIELVLDVVNAVLVRIGNNQARGLLAKDRRGGRHCIVGGKHAQLMLPGAILHAGALN